MSRLICFRPIENEMHDKRTAACCVKPTSCDKLQAMVSSVETEARLNHEYGDTTSVLENKIA